MKVGSWIVDSGASDHMTNDATVFYEYNPYQGDFTIRIADGSLSKVKGIASVRISKNLILKSVLLVPSLDFNLLSVSKLTQELNCSANFASKHVEFQDLDSGKMIGSAEMQFGLYILKVQNDLGRHKTDNSDCVPFQS